MDAHDAEYRAAAAAIHDQTPRGCQLPAVGDRVSFRLKGWPGGWCVAGRVVKCGTNHDGRPSVVVQDDCGDITVLDPRPWPTGNLMQF